MTRGKKMISAEVEPHIKQAIQHYAEQYKLSEAEVIRRILSVHFSFNIDQMATNGVKKSPMQEESER